MTSNTQQHPDAYYLGEMLAIMEVHAPDYQKRMVSKAMDNICRGMAPHVALTGVLSRVIKRTKTIAAVGEAINKMNFSALSRRLTLNEQGQMHMGFFAYRGSDEAQAILRAQQQQRDYKRLRDGDGGDVDRMPAAELVD